jgi:hypothetical protein
LNKKDSARNSIIEITKEFNTCWKNIIDKLKGEAKF